MPERSFIDEIESTLMPLIARHRHPAVSSDASARLGNSALDGVVYEIDLKAENASKLRDGLADFVAHARSSPLSVCATDPSLANSRSSRT